VWYELIERMNKLWSYIAVGFAFFSGGIIVAIKWLVPEKVIVNVKKQRIRGNENRMNVDVPIDMDSAKMARQKKREDKKQARKDKRLNN